MLMVIAAVCQFETWSRVMGACSTRQGMLAETCQGTDDVRHPIPLERERNAIFDRA